MQINNADIDAAGDVMTTLNNEYDEMNAEQALDMLYHLEHLKATVDAAVSNVRSQALGKMELSPILVGDVVYKKSPDIKSRPIQDKILTLVIRHGQDAAKGRTGKAAIEAAVRAAAGMMSKLYVSPSTAPKVGGVKALGLNMGDVTVEEHTGWKLTRVDMSE